MRVNHVIFTGKVFEVKEERKYGKNGRVRDIRMSQSINKARGKDADPEWENHWVTVTVFDRVSEQCADLSKGDRILVQGELRYNEWTKDGEKKSMHKIVANRVHRFARPGDEEPVQPAQSSQGSDDPLADCPF